MRPALQRGARLRCVSHPLPRLSQKLQLEARALRTRRYRAVAMDAPNDARISPEAEAAILSIIADANKSGRLASGWEAMKKVPVE